MEGIEDENLYLYKSNVEDMGNSKDKPKLDKPDKKVNYQKKLVINSSFDDALKALIKKDKDKK